MYIAGRLRTASNLQDEKVPRLVAPGVCGLFGGHPLRVARCTDRENQAHLPCVMGTDHPAVGSDRYGRIMGEQSETTCR